MKSRRQWLLLHFRPVRVPSSTVGLSLSWGLGGMAATLAVCQLITGVLLKFDYDPTPGGAYSSIQWLISTPVGRLMRNYHHWGANLLIALVFLHFLRVFFTSAFYPPRRLNWLIGLGLLALVILSNLTGYLLPWDQLAYWATTVTTGMLEYVPAVGQSVQQWVRGGSDIGPQTLRFFYALHTAILPSALISLMALHFWRVRRAGGLVQPPVSGVEATRLPAWPHLFVREMAMAAAVLAVLNLLAVNMDAPLESMANPGLSPNPTKAPWYFAGFQELLLHMHPTLAVFVIPMAIAITLISLPFRRGQTNAGGIWFISPTNRADLFIIAIIVLSAALFWIWLSTCCQYADLIMAGLGPAATICYGFIFWKRNAGAHVYFQALFVAVLSAFAVLTIVGIWFRGANMSLSLPW